jgi:hypothetical protein
MSTSPETPSGRPESAEALRCRLTRQLAELYQLWQEAMRTEQQELAAIAECCIFDLLDWGRRSLPAFADHEALPAADGTGEAADALTLGALERLLEDASPGPLLMPASAAPQDGSGIAKTKRPE